MLSRRHLLYPTLLSLLLICGAHAREAATTPAPVSKTASSVPSGEKKNSTTPKPSKPLSKDARLWLT